MKDYRNHYGIPMNIFMEADKGAGAGGNAADGAVEQGADDQQTDGEKKPVSFDDLLGDKKIKSEFDRRVNAAIETAVCNAKEKWEQLADQRVDEAKKLENMTKAEKEAYQAKKREADLDAREAAITKKELEAQLKDLSSEVERLRAQQAPPQPQQAMLPWYPAHSAGMTWEISTP